MPYITENFLKNKANDTILESAANQMRLKAAMLSTAKRIFLSHSHRDKELVRGLKNYLSSIGIDLYIDWLDASMPSETNRETAKKIKEGIALCDYVIVLATNNAVNSRWVPWEIGIADSKKSPDGIAIIPVVDSYGRFEGNEYLQLYKRIIIADDGSIAVFEPNQTKGYTIDYWLRHL